ncbi:MAG: carboxypeptidase regulatory-like domain-containing protein [Acidobacteriota bacterium]
MIEVKMKKNSVMHVLYVLLLLAVAQAALSFTLSAQSGTAVVTGVITDTDERVIPGADVTITNQETNVSQRTVTSDAGVYYFGGLRRGLYTLAVELPGFKRWTTQFELQVGQDLGVDPVMEVGEVATTIEVVGVAPVITTDSMEVADVKDLQRIQQLPLNGRQVSNLFELTPGVEGGGSARVNGLKVGALEISLDGISLVDRFGGGIARIQPGLDTVQEFRIETVGSDARYSRPATVTLVTRSGTNRFHGSVFETHRNNGANLRARRREETAGDAAKLIRNEFGVTAGGPFYLGDLYDGRDKTFWFFAYEGLRQRQERVTVSAVPTAAMWGGDLSNLVDSNGVQTILYDPLSTDANGVRQPFPNNVIPSSRIHPMAKVLQALTHPATNDTNPLLGNNLQTVYPVRRDVNNLTFKGDQVISDQDRLSVRWTRNTDGNATEGGVFGNPVDASAGLGTSRSDAETNNVSVNYTRTFTPSFLNELLVGVQRSYKSSGTLADFTDYPGKLGLPNPFGVTGWPTLYAGGGYPWAYWDADNRKDEALTGVVFENNTTWIKGNHVFQFGGKLRPERNNVRELQQAQGSHDWGGGWTALYDPIGDQAVSFTGTGFADLLLGLPSFLSNQFNRGFFYFRQTESGLYFNDKWKLTPRLTVNLGLRWDKWTPYSEAQNRLAAIDKETVFDRFEVVTPGDHDIRSLTGIPPSVLDSWEVRGLTFTTAREIGYPDNLFRADNNNFGPRLGAAFMLDDKTVLRGGYGGYFWPLPLSQILQTSRTNPPLNLRYTNEANNVDGSGTYTLRNVPGPEFFVGQASVDTEGIVPISSGARGGLLWDGRNWKDARAQSWHLSLERELMKDTALRVSYIGEHGRDLEQRASINTREAEFNYVARTGLAPSGNRDILLRDNPEWNLTELNRTGYSNTHSAQIEVEKRYSEGFAFQWFYVFSRSLSTTDAGGFTSGNSSINAGAGGGQVPEVHQIMGSPSLSYDERLRLVYFNSTNVPPHRIRYNGIVDLPFGRGKRWGDASGFLNHVIGGWQIAAIGEWRSGLWKSVNLGNRYVLGDPTLSPDEMVEMTIFGRRQRLWFRGDFDPSQATDVTGGDLEALVPADRSQRPVRPLGPNFDNRLPQELADGTISFTSIGSLYNPSPRAFFLGPGAWNLDVSIFKHFAISENIDARLTADFFNFLNHPLDVDPNNVTGLQDLSRQANEPRTIQLSFRVDW